MDVKCLPQHGMFKHLVQASDADLETYGILGKYSLTRGNTLFWGKAWSLYLNPASNPDISLLPEDTTRCDKLLHTSPDTARTRFHYSALPLLSNYELKQMFLHRVASAKHFLSVTRIITNLENHQF